MDKFRFQNLNANRHLLIVAENYYWLFVHYASYSPHCCDKSSLNKGLLPCSLKGAGRYCKDGTEAGAGGSWSHCVHSQEAERVKAELAQLSRTQARECATHIYGGFSYSSPD